jgi:LPXTG-motif cell wall-anchored protein
VTDVVTTGDPSQVEAESITNPTAARAVVSPRLPSTGANGTDNMAIYAGGLVAMGLLLLAARRRMPGAEVD